MGAPSGRTEVEGTAATPEKSKFAKFVEHPAFKLIAIVATISTISIGARTWFLLGDQTPHIQASSTSNASSPVVSSTATDVGSTDGAVVVPTSAQSPAEAPKSSEQVAAVVAPGDCLGASQQRVPCNAIHRAEVIGIDTPDCDAVAALGYLGGNADLDVLRARLEMDRNMCILSNADHVDISSSVMGMLDVSNGSVGDAFRLCRDDRTKPTDVGCDIPHTGEYVGAPAGSVPDQPECEAAAKAYMSVGLSEVSDDLAVLALPTANPDDGRPRCVITVRGNQVLTASIRNVRTQALPLEAGQ